MKSSKLTTCRLILATALVFAVLPLASQAAGPSASASLNNFGMPGFAPGVVNATPNPVSTSHQEAGIEDSGPDGNMRARGYAVNGVVGANAQVSFHSGWGDSGGLRADSSAHWTDAIDLVLPSRFTLTEVVDHYELVYNVGATGSVNAAGTLHDSGHRLTNAAASISYNFKFGNHTYEGSQGTDAKDGPSPTTGTWGTIAGTAQVNPGDTVTLDMNGYATAGFTNYYNWLGIRDATANADFGSTLIWGGITHVTAFNVSGQVIDLPDDFQLDLIGRHSGFNYWNAAVHPDAPVGVPDSASALLLLAPALLGLGLLHRRRQGVALSS